MRPGGTGSNELLTLYDAAQRLGLVRARADRGVLRMLRRLEQQTGRRILSSTGSGTGRRYLILGRELEAALDGDRRELDGIAERVAEAVQRIEDRVISVSVKVEAFDRRLSEVEKRGQVRLFPEGRA